MKKLKIENLKNELFTGDFGDCFRDYDSGYICDIITEIADNQIDLYTSDLLEWAKHNYEYIEEALNDFGTPTNSNGQADFIKMIQQGQYYYNERNIYEHLEDGLKFFIYDYIEKELKIEELSEEENEKILDWDFSVNNEELENLIKHIDNILK